MKVYFNGHDLSEYLILAPGLKRNLGRDRSNELISTGRGQRRLVESLTGEISITMPFSLIYDVVSKKRELADIFNVSEPVPLWFEDEPNLYYLAIVDGDGDMNDTKTVSKGTIKFLIPDGVAHSFAKRTFPFVSTSEGMIATIENLGTEKMPVDINVTFTSDAKSIGFVSEDNIVQFGTTVSEDDNSTSESSKVLNDGMGSSTGWQANVGRPRWRYPDNGDNTSKIMGALKWDAAASAVYPSGYGSIDTTKPGYWHGPTITRQLNDQLTDWSVFHRLTFKPQGSGKNRSACQGLLEINYMDADGNFVMGFEIKDNNKDADEVKFSFFIGDYRMVERKLPKSVLQFHGGFFGSLQMTKIGNTFTFRLARINGDTWKETWSNKGEWTNNTVAMLSSSTIQVFMSKWKDVPPMLIELTHTRITKYNLVNDQLIPKVFYEGDTLFVDGESNQVFINGLLDNTYRVVGSDDLFIADKGDTDIYAMSDGTFSGYLEAEEVFV